jgi:hypothetical protein
MSGNHEEPTPKTDALAWVNTYVDRISAAGVCAVDELVVTEGTIVKLCRAGPVSRNRRQGQVLIHAFLRGNIWRRVVHVATETVGRG